MIERSIIVTSAIIHHRHLVNIYDSTIGPYTKIASFVEIGGALIGAHCKIQAFAFISPGTIIEDHVFIGPHVVICNDNSMTTKEDWELQPVKIKQGAKIGAGAIILPGITIGEGAVIGAGAIVVSDTEPHGIYVGIPAHKIGDTQ